MNIITLTHGKSARKILVDKEQILALDSVTDSITRIYMRGGLFRDVTGSVNTIKRLVQRISSNGA
ncbi:hypothetical protein [Dyadobacter bucti]|uniref:hypothetical protein n=1 Tax=Dyadobacter bucti TaxID=2572203 RepID=UPI001109C3D4|nr:hypothetical protein [Dyadobacter bucti]